MIKTRSSIMTALLAVSAKSTCLWSLSLPLSNCRSYPGLSVACKKSLSQRKDRPSSLVKACAKSNSSNFVNFLRLLTREWTSIWLIWESKRLWIRLTSVNPKSISLGTTKKVFCTEWSLFAKHKLSVQSYLFNKRLMKELILKPWKTETLKP